jgi:hypothetical protein
VLKALIPVAEIDRRLAGINYFRVPADSMQSAAPVCRGPQFGKPDRGASGQSRGCDEVIL